MCRRGLQGLGLTLLGLGLLLGPQGLLLGLLLCFELLLSLGLLLRWCCLLCPRGLRRCWLLCPRSLRRPCL